MNSRGPNRLETPPKEEASRISMTMLGSSAAPAARALYPPNSCTKIVIANGPNANPA